MLLNFFVVFLTVSSYVQTLIQVEGYFKNTLHWIIKAPLSEKIFSNWTSLKISLHIHIEQSTIAFSCGFSIKSASKMETNHIEQMMQHD